MTVMMSSPDETFGYLFGSCVYRQKTGEYLTYIPFERLSYFIYKILN